MTIPLGNERPASASIGPLSAPNVFISYECERTETPASAIPNSIHETYAQCGEDLIVEGLLAARFALSGRDLATLFYIEIGANHPVQTSNTYLFYRKYGASGVLVEANARLIADLRRVRPRDLVLQTAISARTDAELSFGVCDVSELSSLTFDHIQSFGTGAEVARTTGPNLHINDLIARVADRPLDFLSIDVEGVDLELLEALDFVRFRPIVIQCEPSEHFAPGTSRRMVEWMRKCGYVLAARTSINLIFMDMADRTNDEARASVNSFDVFDTLIARRCVDPLRIFNAVEATSGLAGFARSRREAEVALAGTAATLDDIHTELASRLGLDPDAAAALKQAEIDAEIADVIPIAENLDRVRDGDLLISDMYLPTPVIRALLKKAGLNRQVGLVVTPSDKQSGGIWRQVETGFAVGTHLGDNQASDVAIPRRFGIATEHTRLYEPTQVEQWCLDNGLRGLGELIRAARLRISVADPLARRLLLVQTQYNFPILLLASILLHRHAAATGATRLLFASRDCHLWHALYVAMFGGDPKSGYFFTSRRARINPSAKYRAYVRERVQPGTILIDLCGSGWSAARLMETLGFQGQALYFLHRLAPIPLYEKQHRTPDICRVDAVVGPDHPELDHIRLEMCNYALHGSALDVRDIAGAAVPVFDSDGRSAAERALVSAQMECFSGMVSDAAITLTGDTVGLKDADVAEIVARLYALLCQETCFHTAFSTSHTREDMRTLSALELLPLQSAIV